MSQVLPDTQWIRAVLRHAPATRHLHVDVLEANGHVSLEGRVPTRADRDRAGAVARSAATPGLHVTNHLLAEYDTSIPAHATAPRWQALYRHSCQAMAA